MKIKVFFSIILLFFTLVSLTIPIASTGNLLISFEEEKVETTVEDVKREKVVVDTIVEEIPFDYENSPIFTENWDINKLGVYSRKNSSNINEFVDAFDSTQSFYFPVNTHITSKFGRRWGRMHNGIDVALQTGDSVICSFDGKVRFATRNHNGFGKLIIVRHENGLETYYAHLSKIDVEPNQLVKAGEYIGKGGSTGRVTGPHLHFETRLKGTPIDPLRFIDPATFLLK